MSKYTVFRQFINKPHLLSGFPSCFAQAAVRAQVLLEKNGRKHLLVDSVEMDSESVRLAVKVPQNCTWARTWLLSTTKHILYIRDSSFCFNWRVSGNFTTHLLRSDWTLWLGEGFVERLFPVSGGDEDCEPAECRLSSQSRDAARSPEAFWEGSVCLSGSQGKHDMSVSDIRGGGVLFDVSDHLSSPSTQDSVSVSASDWAVAVCRHLGGSAGGSALVARGTGSSSDITEALRWAEDFARQKIERWCHKDIVMSHCVLLILCSKFQIDFTPGLYKGTGDDKPRPQLQSGRSHWTTGAGVIIYLTWWIFFTCLCFKRNKNGTAHTDSVLSFYYEEFAWKHKLKTG